jgi:hypothetical protein
VPLLPGPAPAEDDATTTPADPVVTPPLTGTSPIATPASVDGATVALRR